MINNQKTLCSGIAIRKKSGKLIKKILIYADDSMNNIINRYELENGIIYKKDYIIEIVLFIESWYRNDTVNESWTYMSTSSDDNEKINIFKIQNVGFIKYKYELEHVIEVDNLENIPNNSDEAILSTLSYLFPHVDVSQLEIINKNNASATIESKRTSNNYSGNKNINFTVNIDNFINFPQLIKKSIFFMFDNYNYNFFKNVEDIKK